MNNHRREENPNSKTEGHYSDRRTDEALSDSTKSGVALRLPPQSKSVQWQVQIFSHSTHHACFLFQLSFLLPYDR
jgi:hypothetical protein